LNFLSFRSDRWDYYKIYILSVFELIKLNDETEGVDNSIEMCHEFLAQVVDNVLGYFKIKPTNFNHLQIIENDDSKKARGPYLARLELHRLMRENEIHGVNDLLGDYLELLVEYFRLFGSKSCCTNDLKMFLEFLEPSRRSGLASRLIQDCGISSTALPKSVSYLF
jgi:N-terminal acetyltransferase B complex non-catalytic subunit